MAGFAALAILGQYAIYRARRYRLTRTIYRGLRFHQRGSAWAFAFRAVAWWAVTALTFGLAYPFQVTSLERYKMRHTYYGDLAGRFEASAWPLLLRGFLMWLLVIGPLAFAVVVFVSTVDWVALSDVLAQGGDDMMSKIEGSNPNLGGAIVFGMLMSAISLTMAALLYPAFQAVVLRWWSSGLRFGTIEMQSRLRMRNVYGAYARFVGYAILFSTGDGYRCGNRAWNDWGCGQYREIGHRRRNRDHACGIDRLRDRCARLFDHLSRHGIIVPVAAGHGIAAIVRSFGARERESHRATKLGDRRRSRRCPQCG